jgi:hypothetical protein
MLLCSCRSGVLNQLRGQPLAAYLSSDDDEDLITVISREENATRYAAGFHFPAGTPVQAVPNLRLFDLR